MKAKCRFKTNDSIRNTLAREKYPSLEIKWATCGVIQATIEFDEKTEVHSSFHNLMVNAILPQFSE